MESASGNQNSDVDDIQEIWEKAIQSELDLFSDEPEALNLIRQSRYLSLEDKFKKADANIHFEKFKDDKYLVWDGCYPIGYIYGAYHGMTYHWYLKIKQCLTMSSFRVNKIAAKMIELEYEARHKPYPDWFKNKEKNG